MEHMLNIFCGMFGVVSMLKLHGVCRRFIFLSNLGSFIRMLIPVGQMYCHLESLPTVTTESELISASHCAAEVAFLRKLAKELGFNQVSPTVIYEDNNDCIALGNSGHFKGRSRHIDLCYMFLSDYIARGLVKFERVDSKNQIADIGTTPRP